MTFKEFSDWCNQRACDGKWGMQEAMMCISAMDTVRKQPFWRRKKEWEKVKTETKVIEVVEKTNELIKKYSESSVVENNKTN